MIRWSSRPEYGSAGNMPGSRGDPMASALRELAQFTDRELADIGLARSDLTQDGLRIAGQKRNRR